MESWFRRGSRSGGGFGGRGGSSAWWRGVSGAVVEGWVLRWRYQGIVGGGDCSSVEDSGMILPDFRGDREENCR